MPKFTLRRETDGGNTFVLENMMLKTFQFHRQGSGPAVTFAVLIPALGLVDAKRRFGPALEWDGTEERFHHVGDLIVLGHDGDGGQEVQTLLLVKPGATLQELRQVRQEAEALLGAGVYLTEAGLSRSWVVRDYSLDHVRFAPTGAKPPLTLR
jgi:hypothetical protein